MPIITTSDPDLANQLQSMVLRLNQMPAAATSALSSMAFRVESSMRYFIDLGRKAAIRCVCASGGCISQYPSVVNKNFKWLEIGLVAHFLALLDPVTHV